MIISLWAAVFAVSLYILNKGADVFVESAKKIGLYFGMSAYVVGVLIVGVGTSMPELAAGLVAALQGAPEVVIANAVGSNITNILLVLGFITAVGGTLYITKNLIRSELPIFAIATIHFVAISSDGVIDRLEATLLLGTYAIYIGYLLWGGEQEEVTFVKEMAGTEEEFKKPNKLNMRVWLLFFGGLAGVILGAKYLVDSVLAIAGMLAIPIGLISISAVAIGTSLPELFVSLKAHLKGNSDLAVGNIVGSNAFNILAGVGLPAMIVPLAVWDSIDMFSMSILIGASFLLFVNGLSRSINRWEGMMLLLFFAFFIVKLFT